MLFGEEGREAKKTKCMASTRGTESLTACSTRAATTGLHRPRLGQKLVGERGTHIPAIVCTTSERSMEFIRRPNGVASVAQATSEFGFKTLIPTEEEFRSVLILKVVACGQFYESKHVFIPVSGFKMLFTRFLIFECLVLVFLHTAMIRPFRLRLINAVLFCLFVNLDPAVSSLQEFGSGVIRKVLASS